MRLCLSTEAESVSKMYLKKMMYKVLRKERPNNWTQLDVRGPSSLVLLCLKTEAEPASMPRSLKNKMAGKVQKRRLCQGIVSVFVVWIFFICLHLCLKKLDVCIEKKLLYYFCYTYLLLRMALHWKRTGTMQRRKCTNYCWVLLKHHFQHCNRLLQVTVQQTNGQLLEPEQGAEK